MHENSLVSGLIATIERLAKERGGQVRAVRVRVGALCNCSPEHFREHFDQAARGTAVEGARLEVASSEDLDAIGADAVMLESIEIEEQDAASHD